MIAVGIDVSKSKSTVAILDSYGTVLATPFEVWHTQQGMQFLPDRLKDFSEPRNTGHYYYPVHKKPQNVGYPVYVVNPVQMKNAKMLRFIEQRLARRTHC